MNSMAPYERTRRNMNFQRRAQVYAYAVYALNHMNRKIPAIQTYYTAKNLPTPGHRNFRVFSNFVTDSNTGLISRATIKSQLAAYKAKLNSNARLYKTAGKSARYNENKKRYVPGHPGMAVKFGEILSSIRKPRVSALKYGKVWMDQSGIMERRANAATAARKAANEAARKAANEAARKAANEAARKAGNEDARKAGNEDARKAVQANYNRILSNDKVRSGMNKVRHYTKLWLNKSLPTNSTYKDFALAIHPNKGNRNHANNQAKRTAIFKLLSSLK